MTSEKKSQKKGGKPKFLEGEKKKKQTRANHKNKQTNKAL